jgi:hypothetical protein
MGSALCWWPLLIEPNLDLPWWVPLACVAICACLATFLCPVAWLWFPAASATGTSSGLCVGYRLWWPTDPIAGPWVPITVAVASGVTVLLAFVAAVAGRRISSATAIHPRAVWPALVACVAFGPVALAVTPSLVAHRIALNDRLAAERFASLKNAVQKTASAPRRICDGSALKLHYSGPRFSDEDWDQITGNYVKQDGYFFMLYCREKNGYTIDAMPSRNKGDGTRHFCTDESGRLGCDMHFNGSRYASTPCPQ